MDSKLRAIYLHDHIAGATAGHELAQARRGSNADSDAGRRCSSGLPEEIGEDRQTLRT